MFARCGRTWHAVERQDSLPVAPRVLLLLLGGQLLQPQGGLRRRSPQRRQRRQQSCHSGDATENVQHRPRRHRQRRRANGPHHLQRRFRIYSCMSSRLSRHISTDLQRHVDAPSASRQQHRYRGMQKRLAVEQAARQLNAPGGRPTRLPPPAAAPPPARAAACRPGPAAPPPR
jgi:hypothetical protein